MAKKLALIPLKTRMETIGSAYGAAARRVARVLSSLDPASYTAVAGGAALSKIRDIVGELDARVQRWAPGAIRAAYRESRGIATNRLEMIGARQLPARKYDPSRHDKKIAKLTKTVMADYWKANRTIERTARKYLAVMAQAEAGIAKVASKLEQLQAFDPSEVKSFISRTVAAGLAAKTKYNAGLAHLTSKDIAAKIREKLLDQIGGGDFININGKNYNLRSYAELVARTRMRESQTEAVKELAKQYDNDLVQFSKHDSPCDVCAQYEGQVFSLSGNSDKYDKLPPEAEPPVHPNCEHTLNPTSENALSWRTA